MQRAQQDVHGECDAPRDARKPQESLGKASRSVSLGERPGTESFKPKQGTLQTQGGEIFRKAGMRTWGFVVGVVDEFGLMSVVRN